MATLNATERPTKQWAVVARKWRMLLLAMGTLMVLLTRITRKPVLVRRPPDNEEARQIEAVDKVVPHETSAEEASRASEIKSQNNSSDAASASRSADVHVPEVSSPDDGLVDEDHGTSSRAKDCFTPDRTQTRKLLDSNSGVPPKPVINLGMPKEGSTTLEAFFRCAGYRSSHWVTNEHGLVGTCMRDAIRNGKPPIASCDSWYRDTKLYRGQPPPEGEEQAKGVEALLQMDCMSSNPQNCVFPQMSYLEELHAEAPNATFVLNFRPIQDWVRSVMNWPNLATRLHTCDLPGLPPGKGNTTDNLRVWHCEQVNRVRAFVAKYPSHALIELDLYDSEYNAKFMAQLFQTKSSCWGHANANPKV